MDGEIWGCGSWRVAGYAKPLLSMYSMVHKIMKVVAMCIKK